MADVEIIFPSKRVHVKPFQLVNLLITTVTALVTGALMLARVGPRAAPRAAGWLMGRGRDMGL
jgi:hypothetical protein